MVASHQNSYLTPEKYLQLESNNDTSYIKSFITRSHTDKSHDTESHQRSNDNGHDDHVLSMFCRWLSS